MFFLYTWKNFFCKIVDQIFSHIAPGGMLMIFLFCSPHQKIWKPPEISEMVNMLACHLQLKMKSKTQCPFLMYRLFVKIKHLPLLSTAHLPLVKFIHNFTAFHKFGTVY